MKSFLGFKKVFNFQAELKKTKYYKNQIARINLKHGKEFTSKTYWQDGVFLSNVAFNSDNFSKSISKTIATGKYEFAPGELRTIEVQKKKRVLYTFRLTDLIMHGVVSQILLEAMEDDFSDSLYSYRAKIDRWQALGDIADFIRRQKKRYADPKRRGVYVIRRDVTKYTDRIPLGSDSPLWKMLEDLLDPERKIMKEEHWDIIRNVIRPEVHTGDNNLFCNTMGVPTGSPISTVLFNFYLLPLDRALTNIPGAFYARYSDDFIFMHESYLVMQEANKIITDILGSLKLATNPLKDQLIY